MTGNLFGTFPKSWKVLSWGESTGWVPQETERDPYIWKGAAQEEEDTGDSDRQKSLWPQCTPWGSNGIESSHNVGDPGSIPRSGRPPEEVHGFLLQYSCLENPMDRGAWCVTVHGVAKSRTQLKWLSMHTCTAGGFFTAEPPGDSVNIILQ